MYRHLRDDGRVFYVGKGVPKRPYITTRRNPYWNNIANYGYSIEVVANDLFEEEALELESLLISEYKKIGQCEANMVLEDTKRIFSNISIQKMSDAKIGNNLSNVHKNNISKGMIKYKYITPIGEFNKLESIPFPQSSVRRWIKQEKPGWRRVAISQK